MLKLAIVGILIGFTVAAYAADCEPCKIIGTIKNAKGEAIEQFKYPFGFPTSEACEKERASDNFKAAMNDLQSKANQLGMLGDDFKNLTAESECKPLDYQPVHPNEHSH